MEQQDIITSPAIDKPSEMVNSFCVLLHSMKRYFYLVTTKLNLASIRSRYNLKWIDLNLLAKLNGTKSFSIVDAKLGLELPDYICVYEQKKSLFVINLWICHVVGIYFRRK